MFLIDELNSYHIQCTAAMNACENAKSKGADVVKQWDASLDNKTRKSHMKVDGEIRELDEPFSNGLMFPGDPSGKAKEVINCRCALLQRARWALGNDYTKWSLDAPVMISDDGTTQLTIIEAKDYKSFKEQYTQLSLNLQFFASKSDIDVVKSRIKSGIINEADFNKAYSYFKKKFTDGIVSPIETVTNKGDMFWHIVKGHQEMMSTHNIDRIVQSLENPNEILRTKDKFNKEGICYILERDGENPLITITKNDIITSYEPSKSYLEKQRREGEKVYEKTN